MKEEKLTPSEAAQFLGFRTNTLAVWRCHGKGPIYHKTGGRVRYELQDLEDYFQSCRVHTTDSMPKRGGR